MALKVLEVIFSFPECDNSTVFMDEKVTLFYGDHDEVFRSKEL